MNLTKLKTTMLTVFAMAAMVAMVAVVSPPWKAAHAEDARVMIFSETYDAASTVDAAGITNAIAAPGAVVGDACIASVGVDVVDLTITCNIVSAGSAEVRMQNESGNTADLASTTWRVFVFPHGTR